MTDDRKRRIVARCSGQSWVAVVATINVAAQVALTGWVRAREVSIFMVVFSGMMAIGSAAWGFVAGAVGIPWALVTAAAGLAAFELATVRWQLSAEGGPEFGAATGETSPLVGGPSSV
jgi:Transmembrane secretion effector